MPLLNGHSVVTAEDGCLTQCWRAEEGWNAFQMIWEFSLRRWKNRTVNDLIRRVDKSQLSWRSFMYSGHRWSALTYAGNIQVVDELVCSHKRLSSAIQAKRGHTKHRLD